ncbi:hypothetical protein [Nonlabens xiamenensis]|uniref:hypothetical protein n=1 Tax=Nonlabens xiamenensis TaxID=2341043 RepID=UPI000F60845A|nr:hypothetical protein [Nonlabens xiamenensis]
MKVGLPKTKNDKKRPAFYGSAIFFAWLYRMITMYIPKAHRENVSYIATALGALGITFINGDDIIAAIAQGASAGVGIVGTVDTTQFISQKLWDPVQVGTDQYNDKGFQSKFTNAMLGYDAGMSNGVDGQIGMPETVDASLWDTDLVQTIQEDGSLKEVQNDLPGYTQVRRMSGY